MEIKKTKLYESLTGKTIGNTSRPTTLKIKANSSKTSKSSGSRNKNVKSCGGCSRKKK